ncbi:MAG TPA: hypothetical protein PLA94_30845 [Myxococcota bacterium]|nr:hypothetical protein [Myxococcota bacterium]HND34455.1 hypothetical protein [Myxococcota bacterium]
MPPRYLGPIPPPELDPGTANVRNLDLEKIGRVYTYEGEVQGDRIEHWVAFDASAVAAINAGAIVVDWRSTSEGDWASVKEALEEEFPEGGLKVATMEIHPISPPATATAASGATNSQFNVLCGDPEDPDMQGGLFRETLANNAGFIDHWRLYSGYEAPHPTANGSTILTLAAVSAGTLNQFLSTHSGGGGTYIKTQYSWDIL